MVLYEHCAMSNSPKASSLRSTASRPDGRCADELRPLSIETDTLKFAFASALVKAGDTHVLCAASVEETVPAFLKGKGVGWLTAEYDMLPASTPTRKPRNAFKVDGRSQEIRRLIGRSLRAALDTSLLGERTIRIDCDVLQADGGTRTLAITGAWVALALAVERLREKHALPQNPLKRQLAAVSVGIVNERCLLDLPYREDVAAEVDMNVVMTSKGEFVEIQGTAESKPFGSDQLERLTALAAKGCRRLFREQRAALKRASKARRA